MIFKTPHRTIPYTQINNQLISSARLSFKAKGILIYLLSKPENWRVYETDIVKHTKDGPKAVRSGIHELIKAGYIRRNQGRAADGKFIEYEYDVSEYPEFIANHTGNPKTASRKGHTSNKDISNRRKIDPKKQRFLDAIEISANQVKRNPLKYYCDPNNIGEALNKDNGE